MRKTLRCLPLFLAAGLLLVWPDFHAAQAQSTHSITVTWGASSTTGAQYNVYRGTTTGGPYTKLTATPISALTYTDSAGTAGTKYFYVVTAFCAAGGACPVGIEGESAFSAETSATFLGSPNPPVAPQAVAN
jgi:fibronectin type 3 domain-containing protein